MSRQPEYVAWLEGQDRESKEALLYGNWYVTKTFESFFRRKWVTMLQDPPFFAKRCRGFDIAGSLESEVNKDCDYTATVLLAKNKEGSSYCIEDAYRFRGLFNTVEEYILELSRSEPLDITYVIPVDAGAAGKAYARNLQQKIAEKTGRHVVLHPTGNKSKLIRFRPFASVCQSGVVSAVSAQWNDWFFDELEQFQGDGKQHDDALDAAVSAFWALNQDRTLPNFTLPDLTGSNPFEGFPSTTSGLPSYTSIL
jgi:predicted phage terminase large subunit-like protein